MLLPSNILMPHLSHYMFIHFKKNSACISRNIQHAFQEKFSMHFKEFMSVFFNSLNCINLKLHNLKFCKSGSDRIMSTIVWGVTSRIVCTGTRVTEETDASIFTHSEHRSSTFFWKFVTYVPTSWHRVWEHWNLYLHFIFQDWDFHRDVAKDLSLLGC
jgi:hypothetical protein